jgi:hypothetical protein
MLLRFFELTGAVLPQTQVRIAAWAPGKVPGLIEDMARLTEPTSILSRSRGGRIIDAHGTLYLATVR